MAGRYRVSPKEDRTIHGVTFASKREAERYVELRRRWHAGEISSLELQPRFVLQPWTETGRTTISPITYVADFRYYDHALGEEVVEDVKGHRTDVYRIKRKMFEARYPQYLFREVT